MTVAIAASFNIFGPPTREGITVGYISTDRGMVEGVTICDANAYAKKDPGTVFIYKARGTKTTRFLNINEVNALQPTDPAIPNPCEDGIVYEDECGPAVARFMGGGGVGVAGNTIIGRDGAVLAVDLVQGGYGYQYPPIVDVKDNCGLGAGALVRAVVGEETETEIIYSDEEDFEEYQICDPELGGFGEQYSPDGKSLGPWKPTAYTNQGANAFNRVIDRYIKDVQVSGKNWWTTHMNPPLRIASTGASTKAFYKVTSPAWGDFLNKYAISPKPPSNAKPSDFAGQWFTFEWDQEFPYDGEYKFRAQCDNKARLYIDNKPLSSFAIGFGGASGHVLSNPSSVKETIKSGFHKIRLDLYNEPIMEKVAQQQPPPASSSEVEFKITTGSMFANGIEIEGLNLNIAKPFTEVGAPASAQINETFKRDVEFGKKYKVIFTSNSVGGSGNMPIDYRNLNAANNPIRVTGGGKRIELKDGDGNDTNFSLDIDSGNAKFSADGKSIEGQGETTITASWNDRSTAGRAVDSIKIADKVWTRSGTSGNKTQTITLSGQKVEGAAIKLRTKGLNVIQMEDYTDTSWDDLVCTASSGQFTDIKGNIAYFIVPHPPTKKVTPQAKSTDTKGEQTKNVFNTVDYIDKANRQLWRTNVYDRGGFLNDYGVCPFDTVTNLDDNPYAGTHKIVWPSVNFPIDGNYTIEVEVDDNVELSIGQEVQISKKGFVDNTSVSTGKLKVTRFIKQGVYPITADLEQIGGGAFGFKSVDQGPSNASVTFNVTSDSDYANKITIPGLISIGKQKKGSQLNQSVSKEVEVDKDYDVILNSQQSNNLRIRIKDDGKRLEVEDQSRGTDFDDLICTITEGEFHSPQADRCKFRVSKGTKGLNPMALAINIQTTFSEKEIQSQRSWNENPMGVALTIDAPNPPVPQQPIPQQEGRCPNNPFWTTRFPGAEKSWHPVRFDSWGDFLNKYGMSPIPPFDEQSTSGGGIKFYNSWKKDVPYSGFFKIKMEADDIAEFWVDDNKVLDLSRRRNKTYGEKLFYIEKGLREFKVYVENFKFEQSKLVNAKVFNTLDWVGGKAAKTESKNIKFKITSASMFANSIRIDELGIFERKEFTPPEVGAKGQINTTLEREVEVNKVYEVELFSNREGSNREWDIKYDNLHPANSTIRVTRNNKRIELMDGDGTDTNFSLDIDSGNVKFTNDGRRLIVQGKDAKLTASWSDNPGSAGVAVDSITIKAKTFRRSGRSGSQTENFTFGDNPNIQLRTVGESILQLEDHTDTSWDDLICSASEGRFFELQDNKAKFVISGGTQVAGGIASGETRKGVTYTGPHLFHYVGSRWGKIINREGVSPIGTPAQSLTDPNSNIIGNKIMNWKGVNFPYTGEYLVTFLADDVGQLYINDKKVLDSKSQTTDEYTNDSITLEKGIYDVRVEVENKPEGGDKFVNNPTGFILKINANVVIGTGTFKSWMENPIAVSAVLIPPPCPRKVEGKGVITEVIVDDPGNGFPVPKGTGYPTLLKLERINIKDPGINYDPGDQVVITGGGGDDGNGDTGAKGSLCQGVGPFGKIEHICIDDGGDGFTSYPDISIISETGVNFEGTPVFSVVRDPVDPAIDPDKLLQVTDLVGLKQTGYYRGRPYYGSVFYQDGVKYAGWYETAGELVPIYNTLQESIDAEVTTPASAILRQGSDSSSNDKRLNLPGTPENLT